MAVYVDDFLLSADVPNGDRVISGRWSHLMADTHSELTEFAARLGLKHSWIQHEGGPLEHYDVTSGMRDRAIRIGAVPVTMRESAALTRSRRSGVPFDVQAFRLANPPDGQDTLF